MLGSVPDAGGTQMSPAWARWQVVTSKEAITVWIQSYTALLGPPKKKASSSNLESCTSDLGVRY